MTPASTASEVEACQWVMHTSVATEGEGWITHVLVLVRVERGVAEAPAGDERHDELEDEVSRAGARGGERY